MSTVSSPIKHADAPAQTGLTVAAIAKAVGGRLEGPGDVVITDLNTVEQAGPGTLTFIRSEPYARRFIKCPAAAALVSTRAGIGLVESGGRPLIFVENSDAAMVTALTLFDRRLAGPEPGVHPTAIIDPSARVAPSASIGPMCTIGAGTVIGEGVSLGARVSIGREVSIGRGTQVHAGVVIYDRCTIGAGCTISSNAVIGADGFGYVPDPARGPVRIPHIGTVEIGNLVDIGANSCVDRGKFGATKIGDATKIDNLCQIAHNCIIGRAVIICGCTGVAGSVTIGDMAVIGAGVGIKDNVSVGAKAQIGARAAVMTSVPANEIWSGHPARPHREVIRLYVAQSRLSELMNERRAGRVAGRKAEREAAKHKLSGE